MASDAILEVERDPEEGLVVTIDEGEEASLQIPPACAGCLGPATKHLPPKGLSWPEFPYCDECVPPLPEEEARQKGRMLPWLPRLFGFLGMFAADVLRPSGKAVRLLLSESGTVRLAFQNQEYASRFVTCNGAHVPSDKETADPGEPRDERTVWDER
jgi:hypothetical protein